MSRPARWCLTLLVGDYSGRLENGHMPACWGPRTRPRDVIAFRSPKDNATVYLKRIVGLPGDRIQMKQGLLHINALPSRATGSRISAVMIHALEQHGPDQTLGARPCRTGSAMKRWIASRTDTTTTTNVYTVPADGFFVLGDTATMSVDSRV